MNHLYRIIVRFLFPLLDFMVVTGSVLLSYGIYRILDLGKQAVYPVAGVLWVCFAAAAVTVVILLLSGAYQKESGLLNVEEIKATVRGTTLSFLCFALTLVLLQVQLPRYVMVLSYLLSTGLLVLSKTFLHRLLSLSRWIPGMNRRVLIYGAGDLGRELFSSIASSPKRGIHPVGFVDDDPASQGRQFRSSAFANTAVTIDVLGKGADLPDLVRKHSIDEIWVARAFENEWELATAMAQLKPIRLPLAFVPRLHQVIHQELSVDTIGHLPLIREKKPTLPRIYPFFKRIQDPIIAAILLILSSPFLWLMARAIKKDSEGPAFFRHERIGIHGRPFYMIKFRTMVTDADPYAVNPLDATDPRVTRIGRFLRRTSLDELPQLINVVKGDMALVGPRPEMPFIVDTYEEHHRKRLAVRPGITGLWQLSCDRSAPIHHNLDYDLYYIRHQSFFLDAAILLETLMFAFKGV